MKSGLMLVAMLCCSMATPDWQVQSLPGEPSLRGSAIKDGVLWVSGSNNSVFISSDQGKNWQDVSVKEALNTDFRDIEVFDAKTAIVMGVGNGEQSRLYLTEDQGQSWQLLNVNQDESGFYDAIAFWDRNNGLLLGDPVDGYYVIKRTFDGGKSWHRLAKHKLPAMLTNEAAFAASGNTLIVGKEGKAWFTTGGFEASVYYSANYGENWQRNRVPLHKENQTSGGYALALNSQQMPFVLGGDYTNRAGSYANVSYFSAQGGWQSPQNNKLGLRTAMSCFEATCITTGKLSTDISHDHGMSWQTMPVSQVTSGFYTLAQENGVFLAAGHDGLVGVYQYQPK